VLRRIGLPQAPQRDAYLPRGEAAGKVRLAVSARSLRTEEAAACTSSCWMRISTSRRAGAAWRQVLLAQLGLARAHAAEVVQRFAATFCTPRAIVRFASALEPAVRGLHRTCRAGLAVTRKQRHGALGARGAARRRHRLVRTSMQQRKAGVM
jgi:hypothetical protein